MASNTLMAQKGRGEQVLSIRHRRCINHLLLALMLVAGPLTGCSAQNRSATFDYNWPLDVNGKKWVKLRVPRGYGLSNAIAEAMEKYVYPEGRPKSDLVLEQLSLSALWPDMALDNGDNHAEFNAPGGGRSMSALLDSSAVGDFKNGHLDQLQTALSTAVYFSKHLCISPPAPFDVDGNPLHAVCHDRDWPDEKPPKFGLKRMGVDFSRYPDMPDVQYGSLDKEDIFYAPELGNELRTLIECTAEEAKTSADGPQYPSPPYIAVPQCKHWFIFQPLNARVSISYRRVYLKDWQAIQAAWERLLQSFIVAPENATSQITTNSNKGK